MNHSWVQSLKELWYTIRCIVGIHGETSVEQDFYTFDCDLFKTRCNRCGEIIALEVKRGDWG